MPDVRVDRVRRRPRSAGKPPHAIVELGIGRTFQNIRLFAADDGARERARRHALPASRRDHRRRSCARRGVKREEREARERARELLDYCGLPRRHERVRAEPPLRRPAPPRGRARARDAIRSCCSSTSRPPGMNPQETAEFTAFVRRVRDEKGLTVLLIEHDMKVVMGVSERDHRARVRREDRGGHAGRDPGGPARDRGVPREGGAA